MKRRTSVFFFLALIGVCGTVETCIPLAIAQLYAECCPKKESLKNFEWAAIAPGTTFTVNKKELLIANITFNWNFLVVDKNVWKRLGSPSDFTIEATFSKIAKGNKSNIGWLYVIARYAQRNRATYDTRLDMIKWTLDEEGGNNGLYLYEWVGGQRRRPVPGSLTRAGNWVNDPKVFRKDSFDIKVTVTKEFISTDLWGHEELDEFPNDTNAGGRPGVGVWSEGGAVSVSFIVYGRKGYSVNSSAKITTTWGDIKAKP